MKTLFAVAVLAAFGAMALTAIVEDAIAEYEEDDMR